jgi:putative ABC transport system ATP-binding protein
MTAATASSTEPVLELRDVVKEYPGGTSVRALDHVDLLIERGELIAIVGPSGSGKSTLLNVMAALDRVTSGRVLISGVDTTQLSDRQLAGIRSRKIGMVFQEFHLLNDLSALENVALGLMYQGVAGDERRRRASEVLERVGLGDRQAHRPGELSGGERQRVAIARAVVGEPDVMFADEPTGNLDSRSSAEIIDLLIELNDSGSAVVVVTHDRETAERFGRQVEVRDGRVTNGLVGRDD